MEHEVNVPFSVGSVRAALAEPERVARCVPGLQLDGAEGGESAEGGGSAKSASAKGAKSARSAGSTAEGRLRVRVGGSTITYRGSLTVTPRGEDFTVKAEGTEARGTGSVRLNLTVVPRRSKEGEGTRLVCSGTVKGDGRIKDVEPKTATTAGHRLLERFAKALGDSIQENPPQALDAPEAPAAEPATEGRAETGPAAAPAAGPKGKTSGGIGEPGDNDRVIPGIPAPDSRESRTSADETEDASAGKAGSKGKAETTPEPESGAKAKGEEPKQDEADRAKAEDKAKSEGKDKAKSEDKSKDKAQSEGKDRDRPQGKEGEEPAEREGVFGTEVPPSSLDPLHDDEPLDEAEVEAAAEAEAAHARRTMIGRSAEEVDHAPPRGRYAPIPLPEPIANSAALRWVAPAAAAVVAGAVFVGRALRRRR